MNKISISKQAYQDRVDNFVVELRNVIPKEYKPLDKLTPAIATKLFNDKSFIAIKSNYVILSHCVHGLTLLNDKTTEYNSKTVSVKKSFKF